MPDTARYPFRNDQPDAGDQLAVLQAYLDPVTGRCLDTIGIQPGWSCWDVGAGAGSIADHLAHAVGPDGRVVATDLDTSRLTPTANLLVDQRDIRHAPAPTGAPFDLIHARLCLLFLPERRQVLTTLVDALRPGGALVVGEFDATTPPRVLTAPSPDDADLITRVLHTLLGVLTNHGADLGWARDVHPAMVDAGLTAVRSHVHAESWTGTADLFAINTRQQHDRLLDAGLTIAELDRFRHLTHHPGVAVMSYTFITTVGRKPAPPPASPPASSASATGPATTAGGW
jgi:SAM-dependent methyltransferase